MANGITTEVFYPRLDIPNMQDMQYIVTDGSTFVDLERDATNHVVSMPDEKALEYTVTNTDNRATPKYRITNTYITDPDRDTLLIRTRFDSLDGGAYRLYLLVNPSVAGGGGNDNAWWDATNSALMASGTETLFGSSMTVVSALKVASPNGFVAHDNGYAGTASDCYVDLSGDKVLNNQFDSIAGNGNVVQCGQVGGVGASTTFTVALSYGSNAASALAAANGSLAAGFADREAAYRGTAPYSGGWNGYVNGLRAAPASVSSDTLRRRAYYVAAMALHAAEDKTFRGASVAAFATPWGGFANGDYLNDGYHRVWGRDLYQQATGLIAVGDSAQALRMAQFMWNNQFISAKTAGGDTTYPLGSFPRFSPVSGISGASPQDLGCCEQFDQNAFAILLAWTTGLADSAAYRKINATADRLRDAGPDTTERWEEKGGKSPSSIAAEIAGLVAAADIARENGDGASAASWEATADLWRSNLPSWTFTTAGYWGGGYYERIDQSSNANDAADSLCFYEGCFVAHDVADFGFLDLVRLGVLMPNDSKVSMSLSPTASARDSNSSVEQKLPDGNVYYHRYNHDNYGETNHDCIGWPLHESDTSRPHYPDRYGRLWPVLSGERGEYELANGRSAGLHLQSMAAATNDGYFAPEQIWDRTDFQCFALGRPTGGASPLNWAEGQYLRLALSIDAGIVKAKYRGAGPIGSAAGKCIDDADASTENGTAIQVWTCNGPNAQSWTWNSSDGTLRVLSKCMDVTNGYVANGTKIQLWDCNGNGAQEWRWRKQNRLVNPQSGRCLDVTGGGTGDGTRLQLWDCNDTAAQAWYLPYRVDSSTYWRPRH